MTLHIEYQKSILALHNKAHLDVKELQAMLLTVQMVVLFDTRVKQVTDDVIAIEMVIDNKVYEVYQKDNCNVTVFVNVNDIELKSHRQKQGKDITLENVHI